MSNKVLLKDNAGMTLIEIMMALAVFGIISLIFVSSVKSYSNISKYNTDYVRMAELARAKMELIKAGAIDKNTSARPENYPPNNVETTYRFKSEPIHEDNYGSLIKIIVGSIEFEDPTNDPDNYVLVGLLPDSNEPNPPPNPFDPPPVLPTFDVGDWEPGGTTGGDLTGNWRIDKDQKIISHKQTPPNYAYNSSEDYRDFVMDVSVLADKSGGQNPVIGDIGLLYFYDYVEDKGDYFGIKLGTNQLIIGQLVDGELLNPSSITLAETEFKEGIEYRLKVVSNSGEVSLYIDGSKVYSYNSQKTGKVGVYESLSKNGDSAYTVEFDFL